MICNFNWCEFYNVVLGGIVTGIIASFLVVWLTNQIHTCKFRKRYGHLNSNPKGAFDWTAYSMRKDKGNVREDAPNGSVLNIHILQDRIKLTLRQIDNREWEGELRIENYDYGLVTYKYKSEHEYGKRECVIGTFPENGETFDYLFLIPTNDKIYFIKEIENGKSTVEYNYRNEIFIRKRDSA